MTLQGLRVRDALGMGEGSSNPLTTPRQLQRQRSLDATDTCRGTGAGVFQMWRGFQMWAALERELDWRRAAPKGGGTGLPSKQRRGPSPKTRLGGPQGSLGRTSLSGPFGPRPPGGSPSRGRRHLGGGRGRGLRAPGKGAEKSPTTPARLRVRNKRGSGGLGAPRPQVTRAQGGRDDAGPVRAREPKSEGWEGAGIPSAHARHSPGSALSGIRSVQSRWAGAGLCRGLPCL